MLLKKPRSARIRCSLLASASCLAILPSNRTNAATVSWNNASGGNWSAGNWTGGVGTNPPTSSDTARFNLVNTYSVTLDVSPTVTSTSIAGSNVSFANSVAGRTYTNTSTMSVSSGSFNLTAATPIAWNCSNSVSFNAPVNINNGNDFATTLGLNIATTTSATATVSGAGSSLTANSGIGIGNISGFTGALIFSSGATGSTTSAATTIGNTPGGTGSLIVQSGSSIGFNQIQVASAIGGAGTGVFTLTVAGTSMLTGGVGPLLVGSPASGSGTATFSSGSTATLNFGMTVNATGTVNVQTGATINTSSGISLTSNASAGGKINVDGAGTSLNMSGALSPLQVGSVAGIGGIAKLDIVNNGTVSTGTGSNTINQTGAISVTSGTFNLNGNLIVNGGGPAGGGTLQKDPAGTLNVASSKTITVQNAGHFQINGNYSMSPGSTITVTGAGSSITQTGGTGSGPGGVLTISNGSVLNINNNANVTANSERVSDGSAGTVSQSGGTHVITGTGSPFIIANVAGSTGTYNLSGGLLSIVNNLVGANGEAVGFNGTGSFTQTGGTHTVAGANGNMVIGYAATGVGTYVISGGLLEPYTLYLGRDSGANGTLTVNGGAVNVLNDFLDLGLNGTASGTVNVTAGSLTSWGIYAGGKSNVSGGTGVLNVSGGSASSAGELRVWNTTGSAISLSGTGTISCASLNTSGNPSRFNWTGGTLNITGPSGLTISAAGPLGNIVLIDSGRTLNVTDACTLAFGCGFTLGGVATARQFNGHGNFVITGTGRATVPANGGNSGISYLNTLGVSVAGALDLNDNDLVVDNTDFTTIRGYVFAGFRNSVDPSATGIVSSTSQANGGLTMLALFDNALVGAPDWPSASGNTIGANAIVGKYTYFGDLNLDGQVTGDDYGTIDANLNTTPLPGVAWIQGDANLDGIVTGDDYGTLDATLGNGVGNPLAAAGSVAVPEPWGLGLVGIAGVGLARRRRRS